MVCEHAAVPAGMAYCRGGPKDGQLLPTSNATDLLVCKEDGRPWPCYRLTSETIPTNTGKYPVAGFVGYIDSSTGAAADAAPSSDG